MALPENRQIPASKFPEKVRKFVSPRAPGPMRMMLARGLVPMKPLVQVCAFYQLAQNDDPELTKTAIATLRKLPPATLRQVAGQRLFPMVLDWLAEVFKKDQNIIRTILLNQQTDPETVVRLAVSANEEMCEVIARNQERLLAEPEIIVKLYLNRRLRASTADRMIDFAARNGLDLSDQIPCYADILAAIEGIELPKTAEEAAVIDARFKSVQATLEEVPEEESEAFIAEAAKEIEGEPEEKRSMSAAGMIREMNIAQKIRLAMIGGKTERGLLIMDSNKVVCRSVIRSPAINDSEAMIYAKNKALLDEVIGYIAKKKKWIRRYQMKLALVRNPKTPISDAMGFLSHLRTNDLRDVTRSRDVPGPIRKAAKAMLRKKMK